MMKWKTRKDNLNIGSMELGAITLSEDNYIEFCVDILNVSENLQAEINKQIEVKKVEETESWKKFYEENPECTPCDKTWSNKPVVIQYNYLKIVLKEGKPNRYSIVTAFEDAENECLDAMASIAVDLSEYEDEIKKLVIYTLIDKFFPSK